MWEKKKTIDSSSGLCNRIWEWLFRKLFFQALPITVSRIRVFQSCQGGEAKLTTFSVAQKWTTGFVSQKASHKQTILCVKPAEFHLCLRVKSQDILNFLLRIIPLLCDVCFDEWDLKFEAAGGDRGWVLGLLIGHRLGMVFTKGLPYFEKIEINDFLKSNQSVSNELQFDKKGEKILVNAVP